MSAMAIEGRLLAGKGGKCPRAGWSLEIMKCMTVKPAVIYTSSLFFHKILPLRMIRAVVDTPVKLIRK
jgi:hypothetical protein